MHLDELRSSMACQLEQVAGLQIGVALLGCTATLRGRVPSLEARQALLDIAADLAPWLNVVDEFELESELRELPHASWTDDGAYHNRLA